MARIYGGKWETIKDLSEGGQARTFLVKDTKNEKRFVLKRLKNIQRIDRFKREIETIKGLSHKNIVQLIDFNLEGSSPYLVTEYCEGGSLTKAESFWKSSAVLALELFRQICEGVLHAHNKDIIHRDLKPENIFLRTKNGPAVVGDFGICFVEKDGTRLTLTEEAVGSRNYMAPELEDGRVDVVSKKSDVYSLGKILYWLISGVTLSREKYRDERFDLKGRNDISLLGWNNIYLEHVNRLLDLMIKLNPDERRGVENILVLTKNAERLIKKEYNPIGKNIKQLCNYCGDGVYELKADGPSGITNFGFHPIAGSDWRVFVCNQCGHVQLFRLDFVQQKDQWNR